MLSKIKTFFAKLFSKKQPSVSVEEQVLENQSATTEPINSVEASPVASIEVSYQITLKVYLQTLQRLKLPLKNQHLQLSQHSKQIKRVSRKRRKRANKQTQSS